MEIEGGPRGDASEAMPSLAPGVGEPEDQPESIDPVLPHGLFRPSAESLDRRNANHMPDRSWSPVCVKGRGKEDAHPRGWGGGPKGESLAKVFLDYPVDKVLKIIVMKDQPSGGADR